MPLKRPRCYNDRSKLWLVCKASARSHKLVYLRKGPGVSGTRALNMAEAYVRDVLGGSELRLQDAAFVTCRGQQGRNGRKISSGGDYEFDLGFRQLLERGRTWYEGCGYRVTGAWGTALRDRVRVALREYKKQSVMQLARAVQRQIDALRRGADYVLVGMDVHNASKDARQGCCADPGGGGGGMGVADRTRALRARRRLLTLIFATTAGPKERLGTWLLRLDCNDYAFFMRTMYGSRFPDVTCVAIEHVGGVRTPGLHAFKRANALRRYSHKLTWAKRLDVSGNL